MPVENKIFDPIDRKKRRELRWGIDCSGEVNIFIEDFKICTNTWLYK